MPNQSTNLPDQAFIEVVNARTHNLKNVSLKIPRHQLVVFTGPSGSGKSSLAVDTIYAEGQRIYLESINLDSRRFLKQLPAAVVDEIGGLPPMVCIDQKFGEKNRRQTVGEITEINDFLRGLFSIAGQILCYQCGRSIDAQSPRQIIQTLCELPEKTKLMILAPLTYSAETNSSDLIDQIRKDRLVRVRIDGQLSDIDQIDSTALTGYPRIEAVTDRLVIRDGWQDRLAEAIDMAIKLSQGTVHVSAQMASIDQLVAKLHTARRPMAAPINEGRQLPVKPATGAADIDLSELPWYEFQFQTRLHCSDCQLEFQTIHPRLFNFNNPVGACPECDGLGRIDNEPPVQTKNKTDLVDELDGLNEVDQAHEVGQASQPDGSSDPIDFEPIQFVDSNDFYEFNQQICPQCQGTRLNKQARSILLAGTDLGALFKLPVDQVADFLDRYPIESLPMQAQDLIRVAQNRVGYLRAVGVGYLSLGRGIDTLSGGEHQRVRLARALGGGLANIGYVLDEPTIGLHPQDVNQLMQVIRELQESGNSLFVVEHDAAAMRAADHIIELGPGAGENGGQIIAQGTLAEIIASPHSLTADFLSGQQQASIASCRSQSEANSSIRLSNCHGRNLKGINVDFPLQKLVAVTGVSGSGKSTLITQTLVPALINILRKKNKFPGKSLNVQPFGQLSGWQSLERVLLVDQRPLGDSSRGCPATVLGLMEPLRDLFAATRQAKQLGFKRGRFSFNNKSGWCPQCRGLGFQRIKMDFVPDVFVSCEACQGRRYNLQTLQVKFNGNSIADVLGMTVDRARKFFDNLELVANSLQAMIEVGLGYLRLGQPSNSLSGGELKRLKIAAELSRSNSSAALIVMDEPTTGLHFSDVKILVTALNKLVDQGHSLIVIEHNLDLIKSADWIIELGPYGGSGGGELLFSGSLKDLVDQTNTPTGRFLSVATNQSDLSAK